MPDIFDFDPRHPKYHSSREPKTDLHCGSGEVELPGGQIVDFRYSYYTIEGDCNKYITAIDFVTPKGCDAEIIHVFIKNDIKEFETKPVFEV